MKIRLYDFLELCVEKGIERWSYRCEKWNITELDSTKSHALLANAIMEEIAEWFIFDSDLDAN